jgi:hypothetical protein
MFTKLLVRIARRTMNAHDKLGGIMIQIKSHRSNQTPSPCMVNLLLLG